ncbi:type III polyketide synthase [Paludisphaera borealis]|uniref:Alpha-pyrone synthesis polyketide synthase-like Pks18 n=1 Tax=Paludisphaera borealis TaxID=1387353 RepID=A0A1U7CZA9_9BACT|nr:type III polyketide synthase [Paludisphaera borealis]APW64274.1 Alpha-pyrone synthesis polyketide synthase-like Pks18 [Paludisphaera borealis]
MSTNTRIAGIGTALPPHRILQSEAATIAKQFSCETPAQERLFGTLYRRAGVEGRNSIVLRTSEGPLEGRQEFYGGDAPTTRDRMKRYEESAGALAVAASRTALDEAGTGPERVTHLVTVSCSGFYAPGFDVALIKRLELSRSVARTHVGFMGCQGALNGLRAARAFVEADPRSVVLLCAVELCSLHLQYGWDADAIVANALFADGAGALVVESGAADSTACYRVVASASTLIDDSEDAMSWRVGDHGFTMTLSSRVPDIINGHLRPWLESWLRLHGLGLDDVGSWAVHPGGPRILSAFEEATGLDRAALEVSHRVLADYGNMSSPTILFILDRLRREGGAKPVVALAFGPGLSVEAALLD